MMDGFSFSEIIIIIIIAIIIYGKDLPQAARKMATLYSKFKRQLSDVRDEISRQIPMDEIQDSLKPDLNLDPGGEPPQTPSLLTASPSESNVLLTWNSASGASTYTIRRSTGPQEPWLIIAMNIAELAWTDTDVQPGKTYHYVVTGVNNTGESGNSDEVIAVLPGGETAPSSAEATEDKPAPPAADGSAVAKAADAVVDAAAMVSPAPPAADAAPANGNGEHPKESPIPQEKGAAPASESKPS
jgi:Sec-independent protein translocase protein TatA